MKLCVGATSRRMIEVAAEAKVHQIVASRRQVNSDGGYIGLTPKQLVEIVKSKSGGVTDVVRDHGGPMQGGFNDKDLGIAAFHDDIDAGFDGLHIDVCMLPRADQVRALQKLLGALVGKTNFYEIGEEHAEQDWNDHLYSAVAVLGLQYPPKYAVVSTGTYVWGDRQHGTPLTGDDLAITASFLRADGIRTKGHNQDGIGDRLTRYGGHLDAYNVAPEFGLLETQLILTCLDSVVALEALKYAYGKGHWQRWFHAGEGTWYDRAVCSLRYMQTDPTYGKIWDKLPSDKEDWIRERLRDAVIAG